MRRDSHRHLLWQRLGIFALVWWAPTFCCHKHLMSKKVALLLVEIRNSCPLHGLQQKRKTEAWSHILSHLWLLLSTGIGWEEFTAITFGNKPFWSFETLWQRCRSAKDVWSVQTDGFPQASYQHTPVGGEWCVSVFKRCRVCGGEEQVEGGWEVCVIDRCLWCCCCWCFWKVVSLYKFGCFMNWCGCSFFFVSCLYILHKRKRTKCYKNDPNYLIWS